MSGSLHGKKILVTREENQAKEFSDKILQHGGKPIEAPLLKITCIDQEDTRNYFNAIEKYQWIFFTSANGVRCFFQLAEKYSLVNNKLQTVRLAAVGTKTEKALNSYGYSADFVPAVFNAEVMAEEFLSNFQADSPILLVRGTRSRDILPEQFSQNGVVFDSIVMYRTTFNAAVEAQLNEILKKKDLDFITFTSPSAVEAFVNAANAESNAICVCIGTTTETRARELGFSSVITADEFTIEGMIESISKYIVGEG